MLEPQYSKNNIGAQFKRYRDRLEMTLEEYADALGLSTTSLWRLENGQRGITVAEYLSLLEKAHEVSVDVMSEKAIAGI